MSVAKVISLVLLLAVSGLSAAAQDAAPTSDLENLKSLLETK